MQSVEQKPKIIV